MSEPSAITLFGDKPSISLGIISLCEAAPLISQKGPEWFQQRFPQRYQRACRFHHEDDRLRCLAAALLLDRELGLSEGDLVVGTHGKPSAPSSGHIFNISHSGKYCLMAFAASSEVSLLGADIQSCDPHRLAASKRALSPEELAWMGEGDCLQRFYMLWTAKEAAVKALGFGLSMGLQTFSLAEALKNARSCGEALYWHCSVAGNELEFCSFMHDEHRICICCGI